MMNTSKQDPALIEIKKTLVQIIQRETAERKIPEDKYQQNVKQWLHAVYQKSAYNLPDVTRDQLLLDAYNDLTGYGPIQPLLEDPEIAEIMVVGHNSIYIEKHGELIETQITFDDENHLLRVINRIVSPLGRRIDDEQSTVDARLPDGSRVNIVVPPVAIDGPCITIRKFLTNTMTIEDLIKLGALTDHMAEFLQACVAARLNILISGATSSGKTTMLNALSGLIPPRERIITIEDAVELQLKQSHIVRLETQPPNVNGTGETNTRALVRNALRMRPDRIIVGEVRSGEAMDMLQAMNTGHSGSLTTLHANSPRDAIARLETMCMMAGLDIPLLAIRKQIASAINLIVHQSRLEDGTRKTTQITEVAGMESDVVTLTDIFKFERMGIGKDGKIEGELNATGIRPVFMPRLDVVGYKLRGAIFGAETVQWRTETTRGKR